MPCTLAKPNHACGAIGLFSLCLVLGCGEAPPSRPADAGGANQPATADTKQETPAQALARGRELYDKHCTACHGPKGMGDGAAAYLLYPKPRNFSSLDFRLISTDNGFPSDQDLFKTITRGMPGSAMPPWEHFAEKDRHALVRYVKKLTLEGRVAMFIADDMSPEEARELAVEQCVPGKPVTIPAKTPSSPAALARGKEVYEQYCVSCHDADGRGRLKRDLVNTQGYPIFARDFTKGIFKGGASALELATRFVAGMPGTPMPTFMDKFDKPEDLWALVHYLQAMVPAGAQEKVRQRRTDLVARKVSGPLGTEPTSDMWQSPAATRLALMPLWWHDDRVEAVRVQAVHDGKRLAVKLAWNDATHDDHQIGQRAFTDAAAIQLSKDAAPPFFAMGAKGIPVNIWHWKATWQGDVSGFRDIQFAFPNAVSDVDQSLKKPPVGRHSAMGEFRVDQHKPLFLSGWGAGNPVSNPERKTPVEDLTAEGFGTLATRKNGRSLHGEARWTDGKWEVVFVRELASDGDGSFALNPGAGVSIAFAIWDGSSGDRNGQKSVTIWHRLALEN